MKILLIGLGSAGDVHPHVGLGLALKKRGHQVTLVAASVFRDLAAQAGLDFFVLGNDEEHYAILRNPDLWHPMKAFPLLAEHLMLKWVRPIYEFIEENYEAGRTVVAAPSTAMGARIAQEKLGVPLATIHLQPSMIRSCLNHQFDNAMRLRRLGCGDYLLPRKFRPDAVSGKLKNLLQNEQVAVNTRKWSAALKNANTLERTCALIEGI